MNVAITSNILNKCVAVSFAPDEANTAAMTKLAVQIGFAISVGYGELETLPKDRLAFFLVHGKLPDQAKARLIHAMRASADTNRRFAPFVCLIPSGPRHQLVPFVDMGFDEVLFLSDSVTTMQSKLAGQIGRELIYVDAPKYFGPDRRRIEVVDRADPRRKYNSTGFRKIRMLRDPIKGIAFTYVI